MKNTMKVFVKLYSTLTQNVGEEILNQQLNGIRSGIPFEITVPTGSTLIDLVASLSLPDHLVKITFVNGVIQQLSYQLQPGDQVGMFPPIAGGSMETIKIDVWLYGKLSKYGGKNARKSFANPQVELAVGSRVIDLLNQLSLPTEERGITFINGDLSAMPNLQPDLEQQLHDGDRVAFFHLQSMWPAQYRHGVDLAPGMSQEIGSENKIFHHRKRSEPISEAVLPRSTSPQEA